MKIAANALAGTRWASYTLRQLAIAKRGTVKAEGHLLPKLKITDRPHLAFRAVHLCWFPEVRPQQMERAIRLAALLKFNYAIIEPWGMYESKKHPWWHWPNPTMTQAEVRRLVAIGKDIGITLIPQINCYGHASSSRGCTIKHSVLDFHPEYEPLFEPAPRESVNGNLDWDGWCWCISNPETQRVIRELIAEMHENFGNPPFFHIGCDEAFGAQTCPECVKTPHAELALKHFTGLAEFIRSRGARAMMWHDMLLEKSDPRWKEFIKFGGKHATEILDGLPKDVVICDWQYSYGNGFNPTTKYFMDRGFDTVVCPWDGHENIRSLAADAKKLGAYGIILTTWDHLPNWLRDASFAAGCVWGEGEGNPPHPMTESAYLLRTLYDTDGDYASSGWNLNEVPQ